MTEPKYIRAQLNQPDTMKRLDEDLDLLEQLLKQGLTNVAVLRKINKKCTLEAKETNDVRYSLDELCYNLWDSQHPVSMVTTYIDRLTRHFKHTLTFSKLYSEFVPADMFPEEILNRTHIRFTE